MQAVIVAGGLGTRMSGYGVQKALLRIGEKTILEHQIDALRKAKIKDIVMCTGYGSEAIEKYVSSKNIQIKFSQEREQMGTGGAVKLAENLIKEDFIFLCGDIFFKIDFKKMIDFHKKSGARITVLVHKTDHPQDSDLIELNEEKKIIALIRKPHNEIKSNISKSSIYIVKKDVLESMPKGRFDFVDVAQKLVTEGNVYGYLTNETVIDIGTPERYERVKKTYGRSNERLN